LQRMDLSLAADGEGARAELERLRQSGILTSERADAADIRAVTRFGRSALCRRLLGAEELRREFRFTLLADASDYLDGAPEGERLLLQGVVDCFIVENGGITVIDYKTDRVTAAEAPERAISYAPQLEAYARALERIRGLPVREKLVYFLTPGVCVTLP
ncbi:MAG: PD-(D/E)XK nuclease family protein, partial [Butyricicoccus sp.]|nr:PD-(D/E)XK nuclease family protein [Butyricicoccus sp.]